MTSTTTSTVLQFTQESFLKQTPSEFVTQNDLDIGNAIKVMKDTKIGVSSIEPDGTHSKIKLASPIGGITTWYIFTSHIQNLGGTVSNTNLKLVFVQDSFLKQAPTTSVTETDLNTGNAIKKFASQTVTVSECGTMEPGTQHRKIKCNPAVNDKITWYVYAPHVAIAP